MAVVHSNGTNNYSAANNVATVFSHNLTPFNLTRLSLVSTRTITLSLGATSHGWKGLMLWVYANLHTTRSITITVKKNGVTQATNTYTAATITNGIANNTSAWAYAFEWTAITGVDNTATWTADITQGSGSGNWELFTSNGTAPAYAELTNATTTLASGDTLIDYHSMTCDTNWSLKGTLGTGETLSAPALTLCNMGSAPTLANNVGHKVNAGVKLSIDGGILKGAHGCLRIGSSGSPATGLEFDWSTLTVGTRSGIWDVSVSNNTIDGRKMSLIVYGTLPAWEEKIITSNGLSVGATSLVVADATNIANGDKFQITKANKAGGGNTTTFTVSSVVGTTVNFSPAITTDARAAGSSKHPLKMIRLNGYGVKFTGHSSGSTLRLCAPSNLVMHGFEMVSFGGTNSGLQRNSGTLPLDDAANSSQWEISNFSVYDCTTTHVLGNFTPPPKNFLITDGNISNATLFSTVSKSAGAGIATVQDCNMYAQTVNGHIMSNLDVFQRNLCHNTSRYFLSLSGSYGVVKDNSFWGSAATYAIQANGAVGLNSAINIDWDNNHFDKNTQAISFANSNVKDILQNSSFGTESTNTADFAFNGLASTEVVLSNLASTITINQDELNASIAKSYVRVEGYNSTPSDYRSWYNNGTFLSTALSGNNAIRAACYNATDTLTNQYTNKTENISTFPIYVGVTLQKASSGTTASLEVDYDDGSSSSASAAASTSVQTLSTIITPTTNGNDVFIKLNQSGDTNTIDWSQIVVNVRKYGYVFKDYNIDLFKTTDDTKNIFTTPVSNSYITQTLEATVAAYTEFSINHSTQTVTISADTTLKRLYDYSQYDLAKSGNRGYAEWLTTADGTNYTSAYNIVLNTGVDLTGGGSVTFATGKTMTRTGTATFDGVIIDDSGTSVLVILNGLVSGSVVQIYNTTDSAEIDKSTVSGTQYRYRYLWTADKDIRVRVRYVNGTTGYLPYEATGTIASTGFTLNVSQESASVYNTNAFDGSTATEFSMTEGVVRVDVDDPDNVTTFQRLYNWYLYKISTTTHIDDQPDYIQANSTRDYIFDDSLSIKNLDTSNPLYIYGANVRNTSGTNAIVDASGGSIFIRGDYPAPSVQEIADAVGSGSNSPIWPHIVFK